MTRAKLDDYITILMKNAVMFMIMEEPKIQYLFRSRKIGVQAYSILENEKKSGYFHVRNKCLAGHRSRNRRSMNLIDRAATQFLGQNENRFFNRTKFHFELTVR
jgi:hypothetical protein